MPVLKSEWRPLVRSLSVASIVERLDIGCVTANNPGSPSVVVESAAIVVKKATRLPTAPSLVPPKMSSVVDVMKVRSSKSFLACPRLISAAGHFAKDCPNNEGGGGGGRACRKYGF